MSRKEETRQAKQHLDRAIARARNRDSMVWYSLDKVPVGVVVTDKVGDEWKIKADGRLRIRFKGKKKWQKANEAGYRLSAWDFWGPFRAVIKCRHRPQYELLVESRCKSNPKTLKDLKLFVDEAYENGFTDKDQPWCGNGLIWSLSLTKKVDR